MMGVNAKVEGRDTRVNVRGLWMDSLLKAGRRTVNGVGMKTYKDGIKVLSSDDTTCMGLTAEGGRGRDHEATETSGCDQTRGIIVRLLAPPRFDINPNVTLKEGLEWTTPAAPQVCLLAPTTRAKSFSILPRSSSSLSDW